MSTTPLMRQYHELKRTVQDSLLFFQVGDFFELFFDDAVQAASILHITLTARGKNKGQPIPLCGVPLHAVQQYIARLLAAEKKVAIAEQVEPAQPGMVVKREITRVFTPGTITDEQLLDAQKPDYILSADLFEDTLQLVFAELLSAQMFATALPFSALNMVDYELSRFYPQEVLVRKDEKAALISRTIASCGYPVTKIPDEVITEFQYDFGSWQSAITVKSSKREAVGRFSNALSMLYSHLRSVRVGSLDQLSQLYVYEPDEFLFLDPATQKNLELLKNSVTATRKNTLVEVLDRALTPMGSRMIQKWILRPLRSKRIIEHRLHAVEVLYKDVQFHQRLKPRIQGIGDVERIVGRIGLKRAGKRDLHQLRKALNELPELCQVLTTHAQSADLLGVLLARIPGLQTLTALLMSAIGVDESFDMLIADGFNGDLDHLRTVKHTAQEKLVALELRQQKETGINSLKIRFNRVQGYYIEVTNTHVDRVPPAYQELQKLVGKRRYMNAELAQLQQDITRAENEIDQREKELFETLLQSVYLHLSDLRKMAHTISHVDALWSLAHVAYDNGYTKPIIADRSGIIINQGRHPIVERTQNCSFVPNDVQMNPGKRTMIITGPNMGGKSTYLRQSALISLMAHVGSFVPAQSATIGLLDRIFTRIGAGDNLSGGESTFLVEMKETAHICNFATNRSLVILDEVGRGTSTHDGLSIARAVVCYLHDTVGALTMFATHYHELSSLPDEFEGIVNMHAVCSSSSKGIVFHHTIKPGAATQSFGIDVARLAGLPTSVISSARRIMDSASSSVVHDKVFLVHSGSTDTVQLEQLQRIKEKLAAQLVDEMSPRSALKLVWELSDLLR